jgi:hypothetical protein
VLFLLISHKHSTTENVNLHETGNHFHMGGRHKCRAACFDTNVVCRWSVFTYLIQPLYSIVSVIITVTKSILLPLHGVSVQQTVFCEVRSLLGRVDVSGTVCSDAEYRPRERLLHSGKYPVAMTRASGLHLSRCNGTVGVPEKDWNKRTKWAMWNTLQWSINVLLSRL